MAKVVTVDLLRESFFFRQYITCLKKTIHTRDRANLPARKVAETFLSQFRGDVSTYYVRKILEEELPSNYVVMEYDELRTDYFEASDPGWEIVFGPHVDDLDPLNLPVSHITVSVKSSILPPRDREMDPNNIPKAELLDFKILKESDCIEKDLHADLEVQVYFPGQTKERIDNFLNEVSLWSPINNKSNAEKISELILKSDALITKAKNMGKNTSEVLEYFSEKLKNPYFISRNIVDLLNVFSYTYLVGFTSANALSERTNSLPMKNRDYQMPVGVETKDFWSAPFRELCRDIVDIQNVLSEEWIKEVRGKKIRPATPRDPFHEKKRGTA